jgi:small subunit ribosomal protein S4e
VKDSLDRTFATRYVLLWMSQQIISSLLALLRITNIFVLGAGNKPWISLPKGKGVKLSIAEERDLRRRRATDQ